MAPPPPPSSTASSRQQLQSITIPRYTSTLPIHYTVVLQLPVQTWSVQRRYSAFLTLHSQLTASVGAPPATLPGKQNAGSYFLQRIVGGGGGGGGSKMLHQQGGDADGELEERRKGLERYLFDVWSAGPRWRDSRAFKAFLEWPEELPLPAPPPSSSRQSTAATEGSTRNATSTTAAAAAAASSSAKVTSTLPGSLPASSSSSTSKDGGTAYRSLGAPTASSSAAAQDRANSSNAALYTSQQQEMDRQDEQLNGLTAILRRQRHLGETINTELQEQTELLRTLDDEVESAQNKMHAAEGKMEKVEGKRTKRLFGFA
ncbi:uncharacterized protein PSFLO_07509 [Pseudozyma flocculosa]|uniref:Endosomal t-SNARE n=1 Tax=Pseudozyma flocculosa TaxID=84751 RepID=A0A5C3FCZ5_9BASI|nr:uncharacterized protein PSFLO_07509 [Pseudozyma flocculosa]